MDVSRRISCVATTMRVPYPKSIQILRPLFSEQHVTLNIGIYERLYFGEGKTSLPPFA